MKGRKGVEPRIHWAFDLNFIRFNDFAINRILFRQTHIQITVERIQRFTESSERCVDVTVFNVNDVVFHRGKGKGMHPLGVIQSPKKICGGQRDASPKGGTATLSHRAVKLSKNTLLLLEGGVEVKLGD